MDRFLAAINFFGAGFFLAWAVVHAVEGLETRAAILAAVVAVEIGTGIFCLRQLKAR